jgi:hypothetical protein
MAAKFRFRAGIMSGNRATPAEINGLSRAKNANHGIVTDIQPPAG